MKRAINWIWFICGYCRDSKHGCAACANLRG
jgi:hypothetical protein